MLTNYLESNKENVGNSFLSSNYKKNSTIRELEVNKEAVQ